MLDGNSVYGVALRSDAGLEVYFAFLGAQLFLHTLAVGVARPTPWRRVLAWSLMAASVLVSWVCSGPLNFRFASSMFAVLGVLRVHDLTTWRDDPPLMRVWLGYAIFDSWRFRRIEGHWDRALGRHFLAVAIAAPLCLTVAYLGGDAALEAGSQVGHYAVRWVVGGLGIVAFFHVVDVGSRFFYVRAGIWLPALNREPWRSRTLDEFWGRRWNAVVCGWFRRHIFAPMARRGHARLGMAASFAASVVMHAWTVVQPAGTRFLLPMGAFFALHGLCTLLEGPLGVRRWPSARARAWTLGVIVLSSPLFVEPMLIIFDPRG